jgi:hypothetical protein
MRRLAFRRRSSVVERILGKAEVGSSILPGGTTLPVHLTGSADGPMAAVGCGEESSLSCDLGNPTAAALL